MKFFALIVFLFLPIFLVYVFLLLLFFRYSFLNNFDMYFSFYYGVNQQSSKTNLSVLYLYL